MYMSVALAATLYRFAGVNTPMYIHIHHRHVYLHVIRDGECLHVCVIVYLCTTCT